MTNLAQQRAEVSGTSPDTFEIGDEVNIRFDRSIVTGVHALAGRQVLTVQTADVEFTFDVRAADTSVEKTGVWHDIRTCPQCSYMLKECMHRDQYDLESGA